MKREKRKMSIKLFVIDLFAILVTTLAIAAVNPFFVHHGLGGCVYTSFTVIFGALVILFGLEKIESKLVR